MNHTGHRGNHALVSALRPSPAPGNIRHPQVRLARWRSRYGRVTRQDRNLKDTAVVLKIRIRRVTRNPVLKRGGCTTERRIELHIQGTDLGAEGSDNALRRRGKRIDSPDRQRLVLRHRQASGVCNRRRIEITYLRRISDPDGNVLSRVGSVVPQVQQVPRSRAHGDRRVKRHFDLQIGRSIHIGS